MPTSIVSLEGFRIDPEVSVPTLAAHRLAAVPMPELEPPGSCDGNVEPAAAGAGEVVRVAAVAEDGVVAGRHRRRHPVRQFGQRRLGDDDGAGLAQLPHERGFIGRPQVPERERAAGRRHVERLDVVLDGDRNAVQRPSSAALAPFAVACIGVRRARSD